MNIFDTLMARQERGDLSLGAPAPDEAAGLRRMNAMAQLRGGAGFRQPRKAPKIYADGLTRGQKKRRARAAADAKVSEDRPALFRHSRRF